MEIRILATDYSGNFGSLRAFFKKNNYGFPDKFAPILKNQEASKLEVSGWIMLELQEFKKKYWFSRQSSWVTMKWTQVVVHKTNTSINMHIKSWKDSYPNAEFINYSKAYKDQLIFNTYNV